MWGMGAAHPFSCSADSLTDALTDAADGIAHSVLLRSKRVGQLMLWRSIVRGWWSGVADMM